ncbi:MAG: hypothetical protein JW712_04255 [Dehalococcoidales bacterium]|nr:hypothetical protein [Dehalococcoidales bacterium]
MAAKVKYTELTDDMKLDLVREVKALLDEAGVKATFDKEIEDKLSQGVRCGTHGCIWLVCCVVADW